MRVLLARTAARLLPSFGVSVALVVAERSRTARVGRPRSAPVSVKPAGQSKKVRDLSHHTLHFMLLSRRFSLHNISNNLTARQTVRWRLGERQERRPWSVDRRQGPIRGRMVGWKDGGQGKDGGEKATSSEGTFRILLLPTTPPQVLTPTTKPSVELVSLVAVHKRRGLRGRMEKWRKRRDGCLGFGEWGQIHRNV